MQKSNDAIENSNKRNGLLGKAKDGVDSANAAIDAALRECTDLCEDIEQLERQRVNSHKSDKTRDARIVNLESQVNNMREANAEQQDGLNQQRENNAEQVGQLNQLREANAGQWADIEALRNMNSSLKRLEWVLKQQRLSSLRGFCKITTWGIIRGALLSAVSVHDNPTFHEQHRLINLGAGPAGSANRETRFYGIVLMDYAGKPMHAFLEGLLE